MSKKFVQNWSKVSKPSVSSRIVGTLRTPVPLRERISKTIFSLNRIHRKLEDSQARMRRKDKTLFKKCVQAQEAKDATASAMYANECAQVRTMIHTIMKSRFALEQVALRLETVRDFGDIATQIVPVLSLVHSVKNSLAGVIPEVSMQLGAIGETLDSLVLEVGEATGQTWDVMATGEEAEKILNEAATLAKQRTKDRFPDLPVTEKDIGTPSFEGP